MYIYMDPLVYPTFPYCWLTFKGSVSWILRWVFLYRYPSKTHFNPSIFAWHKIFKFIKGLVHNLQKLAWAPLYRDMVSSRKYSENIEMWVAPLSELILQEITYPRYWIEIRDTYWIEMRNIDLCNSLLCLSRYYGKVPVP